MTSIAELNAQMQVPIANWDPDTAWERFTGFRNLTVEQFCEIQEQLLVEQIRTIGSSKIGMRLLRMGKPTSVEEFRKNVPITTYADYTKYLAPSAREDLPAFEYMWTDVLGSKGEKRNG